MDFSFTEEQMMFKDQIIRFATKEIVPRVQDHELSGNLIFSLLESWVNMESSGYIFLKTLEEETRMW